MSTTEPPSNSGPGQRLSLVSPSPLHSLGSPGSKTRQRSASDAAPLFDSMALSLPPSLTSQPSFNPLTELPTTVPTREEWTKDEEVAACVVCHEHFSLFNRRHHCRRCGRVVCSGCSQHRMMIPGYSTGSVRVCNQCFSLSKFEGRKTGGEKPSEPVEDLSTPKTGGGNDSDGFGSTPRTKEDSFEEEFEPCVPWHLYPEDADLCEEIRKEFSFDQAPSTSLCISILELHSDARQCALSMIELCHRVSMQVVPQNKGIINKEVDHNLVIECGTF
jgi:zinc finger FYVE domain-containing protein 26